MMKRRLTIFYILAFLISVQIKVQANNPEVSVAGFFELNESGRTQYNFNPGWRFYKGNIENGETVGLNDSDWEIVSIPHTAELVPAEASGGRNYQGPIWYRKHFIIDSSLSDRDISLYFEIGRASCRERV